MNEMQLDNHPCNQLIPPPELQPEAIAEWNRVISAVEQTGRTLKPADRTLLALYVSTWTLNQHAYSHVARHGAIIKWPNGLPGASPQYKTFIETSKQLHKILTDLGCTPASRDFDIVPPTAAPTALPPLEI